MTDRIEEMIFIYYTKTEGDLVFKAVLRIKKDEYNSKTPEEIEAIKEQNFRRWLNAVNNPVDLSLLDVTSDVTTST